MPDALKTAWYGDPDGYPVVFQSGSPGTRHKRPEVDRAARAAGVRLLVPDRPGYGGAPRLRGRAVASVVDDVLALADAQGWSDFAVAGASGGGPHALACAALIPDRVTRCAVSASIAPPEVSGPEPAVDDPDPRRNRTSWLAAHDPSLLRQQLIATGQTIYGLAEAGGPEFPGSPGRALDDPEAMVRLRATFLDSIDGWLDDNIAFAAPWGFSLADVAVPVSLWFGSSDTRSRTYAQLLHEQIPESSVRETEGGHIQSEGSLRQLLTWCAASS